MTVSRLARRQAYNVFELHYQPLRLYLTPGKRAPHRLKYDVLPCGEQ